MMSVVENAVARRKGYFTVEAETLVVHRSTSENGEVEILLHFNFNLGPIFAYTLTRRCPERV